MEHLFSLPAAFAADALHSVHHAAACSPGEGHSWTFAYGANMGHAKLDAIGVHPAKSLPATLPGHELHFSQSVNAGDPEEPAFAVVRKSPSAASGSGHLAPVHGVVHAVSQHELQELDTSEGHAYERQKLPVEIDSDGKHCKAHAWTYLSKEGAATDERAPSTRYARLVVCGAEEHHLQNSYVQNLRQKLEFLGVPGHKLNCDAPLHPHRVPTGNLDVAEQSCIAS